MRKRAPALDRSPRLLLCNTQPRQQTVLGPLLRSESSVREIVEVLVERVPRDTGDPDDALNRRPARFRRTSDGERRCRKQSRTLLQQARLAGLPSIVLAAPRG